MTFYEKYLTLCNKSGKTPSAAALELGLSKTSVNRWKNGGGITDATILKVANYFHVTADELVGDVLPEEKEKAPATEGEGYTEVQKAAIQFVLSLPPEKLERFIKMGRAAFEEGQ